MGIDAAGDTRVELRTALSELVAQDPCCYYKMVDASIRRHGSEKDMEALLVDALKFVHPSSAAAGRSKGQVLVAGSSSSKNADKTSSSGDSVGEACSHDVQEGPEGIITTTGSSSSRVVAEIEGPHSTTGSSSRIGVGMKDPLTTNTVDISSSSSKGGGQKGGMLISTSTNSSDSSSRTATTTTSSSSSKGGILCNCKQTQAFLSALLSYQKVILLLQESAPASWLMQYDVGVRGLMEVLCAEGIAFTSRQQENPVFTSVQQEVGSSSSSRSSADMVAATAAAGVNPEEEAACNMLTLCVLSRFLVTYCERLLVISKSGNTPSSGSISSISSSSSSTTTATTGSNSCRVEPTSNGSRSSTTSSRKATGSSISGSSTAVAQLAAMLQQLDVHDKAVARGLVSGQLIGAACYALLKRTIWE